MSKEKSPKELEELAKNYGEMTADERRLYDLLHFQKTGQHTDAFKNKGNPKPEPEGPVLKKDLKAAPVDVPRFDPPFVNVVIQNDDANTFSAQS